MKFNVAVFLSFILYSGLTQAVYECPPSSSKAGGYVPEECRGGLSENDGVVESIKKTDTPADASGVGAVAGAVAGGAIGNIAGKKNKTLSTVIGAVAGGVAGHYGEKYLKKTSNWEVVVNMSTGEKRTINLSAEPEFKVGDTVTVSGETAIKKP